MTIWVALRRARASIVTVAATYVAAVILGVYMAHSGNSLALSRRDALVSDAQTGIVLSQDDPLRRAVWDFGGNALAAGVDTLLGFGVVPLYPMAIYRGWVGGIVSVDGEHASRLAQPRTASYYISVVLLQLLGYSLAGGAGVNLGLSLWRSRPEYAGSRRFGIPIEALRDVLRIYVVVIPVLLIAALWEFLSPWS